MLLIVSFAVQSQTDLDAWMATTNDGSRAKEDAKRSLQAFVNPLLSSRIPEQKLLRKAFQKLHATYLKKYEAYSDFSDVFSSGKYDCLTATALFSHVLNQLGLSYEIIETNYHIFLMVHTKEGNVLLEMTDRWGGFVKNEDAIAKRTGDYRRNFLSATSSDKIPFEYSFKLYQPISPEKLTGLLYFNQAVKAFNRHDWVASSISLEVSNNLYSSPRCNELGSVIIRTVMESSLEEQSKALCMSHLRNVLVKKSPIVAAN